MIGRGAMARVRLVLFALVWASCAWFGSWELNPNNATRMFAALSIVEDHDATIDQWDALTIDKAHFGEHLYLDKAPGMTLMALPAVAALAAASPERSRDFEPKVFGNAPLARFVRLRMRVAAATGPAVLTGIAAVLLFDLALTVTGSGAGALVASLGYALGTPAWGWSTTITGHAVVAALFVIALWAGWRAKDDPRLRYPVVLGASLGWAVVVEYQAVLAGSALALWAAWRIGPRWRVLGVAAMAGVVAMLPLVGYNLFAFGTPMRLGYQGVVGFEGMNRGLFGLGLPDPAVLWEVLFGTRRGLIWVAPVLVMAPLGFARLGDDRGTRELAWVAGAVAAIALLVNAAYVYWDGGNATGPRHALPLVGVAALGIAGYWPGLTRVGRWMAAAVLAGSVAINAAVASAEIFAPPTFAFEIEAVWVRFAASDLRTVASEWFGWTPWAGFGLWLAAAVPAVMWLARRARRIGPGVAGVRRGCA